MTKFEYFKMENNLTKFSKFETFVIRNCFLKFSYTIYKEFANNLKSLSRTSFEIS